jgi:thioredoxin-dependent peroxiredoxin
MSIKHPVCFQLLVGIVLAGVTMQARGEDAPKIGDTVQDYEFKTLDGKKLKLTDLGSKGGIVLVVLRGFPGYQCPICTEQVADLRKRAEDFAKAGATVLLVYPGAATKLDEHAKEFLKSSALPAPLILVTDPDYAFVGQHGLRWDAKGETAYPSAFVLDGDRKVYFAKISKSHGDRASTDDLVEAARRVRTGDPASK